MTEFIHKVTAEDDGMEVREIIRQYFDFSSRLRNKIKREKLVTLNDTETHYLRKRDTQVYLKVQNCFFHPGE